MTTGPDHCGPNCSPISDRLATLRSGVTSNAAVIQRPHAKNSCVLPAPRGSGRWMRFDITRFAKTTCPVATEVIGQLPGHIRRLPGTGTSRTCQCAFRHVRRGLARRRLTFIPDRKRGEWPGAKRSNHNDTHTYCRTRVHGILRARRAGSPETFVSLGLALSGRRADKPYPAQPAGSAARLRSDRRITRATVAQ
jgi:hypothetical protein